MALRVICRTIVLDQGSAKVLLVRNAGADFWYAPGGGWDHELESIEDCAVREVREEAGVAIYPVRLLYVQEFRPGNGDTHIELFWFGYPIGPTELSGGKDLHGVVEEARWFSKDDLQPLKIFPKRLKDQFWHELGGLLISPNPFLK
jgi:ADP-ribose pyrophosphatase YjhB (NUDIX family)